MITHFQGDELLFTTPLIMSLRREMALALRAAHYYFLGESTNAQFSVLLPGCKDILLIGPVGSWANASCDSLIAVHRNGKQLAGVEVADVKVVMAHFEMHAVSSRSWVLHMYTKGVVDLATGTFGAVDEVLGRLAKRFGERVYKKHQYEVDLLSRDVRDEGVCGHIAVDILLLSNNGIAICADHLQNAFSDLYFIERSIVSDYLLRTKTISPATVSSKLSALLYEQYKLLYL